MYVRIVREIRTEVVLDAAPGAVWDVLTDLDAYEEWNPQTVEASGIVAEGERIELAVRSGGGRERTLTAEVVDVDPARRLEWVATVGTRWLFSARHAFDLEPLEDGRTRLRNRETLSGALVPFVVPDDAESDYEAMNRALAERLETVGSTTSAGSAESTRSHGPGRRRRFVGAMDRGRVTDWGRAVGAR